MVKPNRLEVGDVVRVGKIPPDLHDAAGIGTPDL
jgi:hypothetical protein